MYHYEMTEADLDRAHADLLLEQKRAGQRLADARARRNGLVEKIREGYEHGGPIVVGGRLHTRRDRQPLPTDAELVDAITKADEAQKAAEEVRRKLARFS